MTVYLCDNPVMGEDLFHLWGDDPLEAEGVLWAIGAEPDELKVRHFTTWDAWRITAAQLADVLLADLGVVLTDKLGPAYWFALRDGNREMVEKIGRARAHGVA